MLKKNILILVVLIFLISYVSADIKITPSEVPIDNPITITLNFEYYTHYLYFYESGSKAYLHSIDLGCGKGFCNGKKTFDYLINSSIFDAGFYEIVVYSCDDHDWISYEFEVVCTDQDGDGYYVRDGCGTEIDCNDSDAFIYPGANETCDGIDNDCDGRVDEDFDKDHDGYTSCEGDCNDNDVSIHPKTREKCDGIDNDCDGEIDEGCKCDDGTSYNQCDENSKPKYCDGATKTLISKCSACGCPEGYTCKANGECTKIFQAVGLKCKIPNFATAKGIYIFDNANEVCVRKFGPTYVAEEVTKGLKVDTSILSLLKDYKDILEKYPGGGLESSPITGAFATAPLTEDGSRFSEELSIERGRAPITGMFSIKKAFKSVTNVVKNVVNVAKKTVEIVVAGIVKVLEDPKEILTVAVNIIIQPILLLVNQFFIVCVDTYDQGCQVVGTPCFGHEEVEKLNKEYNTNFGIEIYYPSCGFIEIKAPISEIDWRNKEGKNWMTSVKNQGYDTLTGRYRGCGSCWAFSAIGAVEAVYKIENNQPDLDIDLSEQELVSCSTAGDCEGGHECNALYYYIKPKGILTEECYPYTAQDSSCSPQCSNRYFMEDVKMIPSYRDLIKKALEEGPLSTDLAWGGAIQFDESGIGRCGDRKPTSYHAIVLVGYNDDEGYWIFKNSWGSYFGDKGYGKIAYGECGIDALPHESHGTVYLPVGIN